MTDKEAIKTIKNQGSKPAGMILFNRYEKKVFSFYRYMGLNIEDAEDLTQEVFERVFRFCKSFNLEKPFKPWLYQIMRNRLIDFRRINSKMTCIDINGYDFKETINYGYNEEDYKALNHALSKLENHEKELILLAKFHRLSYAEIATILGISESAIKTKVHRIIKKLTDYFKKHHTNE